MASSEAVRATRALKLKTVTKASTDGTGFVMLDSDAYGASMKAIMTPKVMKTPAFADGTKKGNLLAGRVLSASSAAWRANSLTQALNLRTMLAVMVIKARRQRLGVAITAEDKAAIGHLLATSRRSATDAAVATGLVAGYEAILNENKDPKVLDDYAKKTAAAVAGKNPAVPEAEVTGYVNSVDEGAADTKARYAAMMRQAFGDERWESSGKKELDQMFADVEKEKNKTAKGPAPKRQRDRLGPGGGGGGGGGGATAADAPSGGDAPNNAPGGQVGSALKVADAVRRGDVAAGLESGADIFPADSAIRSSLKGVAALTKGDAKGAVKAALELAPVPGPAKIGLTLLAGLF